VVAEDRGAGQVPGYPVLIEFVRRAVAEDGLGPEPHGREQRAVEDCGGGCRSREYPVNSSGTLAASLPAPGYLCAGPDSSVPLTCRYCGISRQVSCTRDRRCQPGRLAACGTGH
jgi:hypothetical protein